MKEESVEDFGEEIEPGTLFRFECHAGLSCFGRCCKTKISLTPYDIAKLRRYLDTDTPTFLHIYGESYADPGTGFPCAILKSNADGSCVFSKNGGCEVYESRPGCCRNYPLSQVIDEDGMTGKRVITYRLQHGAGHCRGFGRGTEWTIPRYCEANGLEPYERANALFLDIAFEFYRQPRGVRNNKEVQQMIFGAVFDFDRFFGEYGCFPHTRIPDDDERVTELIRTIALGLIDRAASLPPNDEVTPPRA
jgi:Fe-S-cluster containining protein